MVVQLPRVRVTEIGEFIRHQSCERRFKLEFNNREIANQIPFASRLFNSIDPVLQKAGRTRENEWEASLKEAGLLDITNYQGDATSIEDFISELSQIPVGQDAYGREIGIGINLGAFHVEGRMDFVLLRWDDTRPKLWIVEGKASRRDRTYHRIQVTLYRLMLETIAQSQTIVIGGVIFQPEDIECLVVRVDEVTNEPQIILALEPIRDLEREKADVIRLLDRSGPLYRIHETNIDLLDYQLDMKCDGCVFNVHCFPETALKRGVQLLSLDPSNTRILHEAGIGTIDDLAEIDLAGPQAQQIRQNPSFSESLNKLKIKAGSRRSTLPEGSQNPDEYPVQELSYRVQGQLPQHQFSGHQLVRVYLSVDHDYVENRLVALSAHVTNSDGFLHTNATWNGNSFDYETTVQERIEVGRDTSNKPIYNMRSLRGKEVVEIVSSEWSGQYDTDTGIEKQLIQGFFRRLVEAISEVAQAPQAPIHFYVWSRTEMTKLIEACSRVDSRLLSHLRELLGCRESLDQLIFSCLQNEVEQRYALGWTGRGLSVITSLRWYGSRYHWVRRIASSDVDLEREYTQDIFDFKTDLYFYPDGTWAGEADNNTVRHKFEIRSRFFDAITAPYWYAYWGVLPDNDPDPRIRAALRRYSQAVRPNYLRTYLIARVHALRWVEEKIGRKNQDIAKPILSIQDLQRFDLGIANTARVAVDFLRLDQHVSVTDWLAANMEPPINNVSLGRVIPVRDIEHMGSNILQGNIELSNYDIDLDTLNNRCTIDAGSLVRLSVYSGDPHVGQTIRQLINGGVTCSVTNVDWQTGHIELEAIPAPGSRYVLPNWTPSDLGIVFDFALIADSVSDFVAGRVENRLAGATGVPIYQWFDPINPQIPVLATLDDTIKQTLVTVLESFRFRGNALAADQVAAIMDGLNTRVQLLQGPPGTGKTMTTAIAVLMRVLVSRSAGDIVLIGANTHTAVNTLLERIDSILDDFGLICASNSLSMPTVALTKVHTSYVDPQSLGRIQDFLAGRSRSFIQQRQRQGVVIVGGTTSALLKLASELSGSRTFPNGFESPLLIVDEASMMVFPHFLAIASYINPTGQIMLAGDHRQLAPIVSHDWEKEDRPPVILYQPYVSAYQAIHNIGQMQRITVGSVKRSALSYTFRLPPVIRDLIAKLYKLDNIDLQGLPASNTNSSTARISTGSWEQIWYGDTGLFLVLHDERQSQNSNTVELEIIQRILDAGNTLPQSSVAIVTPHRAQRSLLKTNLRAYSDTVDLIDTVERLQGGERPTVIMSATVSDPAAISKRAEFILNLNRSNVAFSRSQNRLIVICSEELINHIPVEIEYYDAAMLWKSLRNICSALVATENVSGHTVRIFTPRISGNIVQVE